MASLRPLLFQPIPLLILQRNQPLLPLQVQPRSCLFRSNARILSTRTRAITRAAPLPPSGTVTDLHALRIELDVLGLAAPAREAAPESAVAALYTAPGFLPQREDERVCEAHERYCDGGADAQEADGLHGPFVPVVHAVHDKGKSPHAGVHQG